MNELVIGIISGIIGIIGTLLALLFKSLYDKEKNKTKQSKEIIKQKYDSFKKIYKEYQYIYASMKYINITTLNELDDKFVVDSIKIIREIYEKYQEIITRIINELEEDYYITQQFVNWKELKSNYIKLLGKLGQIDLCFVLAIQTNIVEKKQLEEDTKTFTSMCEELDKVFNKLDYDLQETLYKDLF